MSVMPWDRELQAKFARSRKVTGHICAVCAKAFNGISIRRYCSWRCKVAAYRRRKKVGG